MYDARSSRLMADNNGLFAIVSVLVVSGCFFGVLLAPDVFGGKGESSAPPSAAIGAPVLAELSNPDALNEAMANPEEQRLLKSLLAVAPNRYMDLQRTFSENDLTAAEEIEAVQSISLDVLADNAGILKFASSQSLNRVIDGLVADMQKAQASGTKYCNGGTYAGIAGAPEAAVMGWAARQDIADEAFYPTVVRINADLMDVVRQAKTTPVRHGLFTRNDEVALQRAIAGVISEPAFVRAMMGGQNQEEALKALDLCSLGVTALTELRRLPDDVKGRAWTELMKRDEVRDLLTSATPSSPTL